MATPIMDQFRGRMREGIWNVLAEIERSRMFSTRNDRVTQKGCKSVADVKNEVDAMLKNQNADIKRAQEKSPEYGLLKDLVNKFPDGKIASSDVARADAIRNALNFRDKIAKSIRNDTRSSTRS